MTAPAAAPAYQPIATLNDLQTGALKYITRGVEAAYLADVLVRASRQVEHRCQRRFSPFYGLVESDVAEGVSAEGFGYGNGAQSLGFAGDFNTRRGYGDEMVRDFWVRESAPQQSELWTYGALSVRILRPYSGDLLLASQVIGPQSDTGHCRFLPGTYCPPGSTIVVTYSGGYTGGFPEDLVQAVKLTAAKTLILEIEPQNRPGLDTNDLDGEITEILSAYAR